MKKIMFSDKYLLTQAVLEGRKTMTRRIIKCPKTRNGIYVAGFHIYTNWYGTQFVNLYDEDERDIDVGILSPKYVLGETIAIAQSYEDIGVSFEEFTLKKYGVKHGDEKMYKVWKNKMFVEAKFMPNRIVMVKYKAERLQDISDEDCMKEGVELNQRFYDINGEKRYFVRNLGRWRGVGCTNFETPREAFASLIDKINGKGTWESNPYVWAYEFQRIN